MNITLQLHQTQPEDNGISTIYCSTLLFDSSTLGVRTYLLNKPPVCLLRTTIHPRVIFSRHERLDFGTMINWALYTVPEIKAELKSHGLVRTGRKADLVSRLTAFIENERFSNFPNLPLEIRQMIWSLALPRRRVIEFDRLVYLRIPPPRLRQLESLQLVNKEAFGVVYHDRLNKHPGPKFSDNVVAIQKAEKIDRMYHDDVFLFESLYEFLDLYALPSLPRDLEMAKTIAFDAYSYDLLFIGVEDHQLLQRMSRILRCQKLQEIILIEPMSVRPGRKHKLETPSFIRSYSSIPSEEFEKKRHGGFLDHVSTFDELKALREIEFHFTKLY